jgi:hypothetical protein
MVLGDASSSRSALEVFRGLVHTYSTVVRAQADAQRVAAADLAAAEGGVAVASSSTTGPRDAVLSGVMKLAGELELALQRCLQHDSIAAVRFKPEPEIVAAVEAIETVRFAMPCPSVPAFVSLLLQWCWGMAGGWVDGRVGMGMWVGGGMGKGGGWGGGESEGEGEGEGGRRSLQRTPHSTRRCLRWCDPGTVERITGETVRNHAAV